MGSVAGLAAAGILVNAAVIATFPASFTKLAFDPLKDLVAVGGIGVTPTLLVAAKSVPADDLKGLVQLSRQRPEGLSFSTAGYGLLQHLAVEAMDGIGVAFPDGVVLLDLAPISDPDLVVAAIADALGVGQRPDAGQRAG